MSFPTPERFAEVARPTVKNRKFYINGAWVDPISTQSIDVISPATGKAFTSIAMASREDMETSVVAVKAAFVSFSRTPQRERESDR